MAQLVKTYRMEPTAQQFHNAGLNPKIRVRGVRGVPSCVDGETEFLTPDGEWVRVSEFRKDFHQVAVFNPETNAVSFEHPLGYVSTPTPGAQFLHFKSRGLDMAISENHRVLYSKKFNRGKWRVSTALDIAEQHDKLADGWDGLIPTCWQFNDRIATLQNVSMSALQLQVAVCADGHLPLRGQRCAVALRKPRKINRLRALLEKEGLEYTETPAMHSDSDHKFYFVPPFWSKSLKDLATKTTDEQLSVIAYELLFWDGHRGQNGHDEFYTSVREEADYAQLIFVSAGFTSKIGFKKGEGARKDSWRVGCETRTATGVRYGSQKHAIERVTVDHSYCFMTSTGFWVARRNGKVFITGNSGKSVMCLWECFFVAIDQYPVNGVRKSRFGIFRATYPSLSLTTIKTVANWFPEDIWPIRKSAPMQQTIRFSLGDGTKVEIEFVFMAIESEDDIAKLKSLELTGAWLNEVFEMDRQLVTTALERTGRYPPVENDEMGMAIPKSGPVRSSIWMDTNSPADDHWYAEAEANPPEGWQFFVQPAPLIRITEQTEHGERTIGWEPNPEAENIRNIGEGYDYYLKQVPGLKEAQLRVNIENKFASTFDGKAVYEREWDKDTMMVKDIDPFKPIGGDVIVGFDTTGLNPGAVFVLVEGGAVYAVHELIGVDIPFKAFLDNVFIPFVATHFLEANLICVVDPANPRDSRVGITPQQDLVARRFKAVVAPTNTFSVRVGAVTHFLGKRGGLYVANHCTTLIKGFDGGYRYPRLKTKGTGRTYGTEPVKDIYSTAHDAFQYACLHLRQGVERALEDSGSKAGWKRNRNNKSTRKLA